VTDTAWPFDPRHHLHGKVGGPHRRSGRCRVGEVSGNEPHLVQVNTPTTAYLRIPFDPRIGLGCPV
jgi:hypothetical protein